MNNIFDLSELADTQNTEDEQNTIEQEEAERAALFGLNEDSVDTSKYINKNTSVKQNDTKLQDADSKARGEGKEGDDEDPTKLFFPDKKADEEEEDDDSTEEAKVETTKQTSTSNSNTVKALAEALISNGVLVAEEEDLKDLKEYGDLEKLVKNTIKNSEYADLNDSQKEYLEALRVGVPDEYIQKHQNITSQLNSIAEEDITDDENLAVTLYSALLKNKGFNEEKISRYVEIARTNNTLITEAKESLEELKEIQSTTFAKETQRLAEEKEANIAKAKAEQDEIKNFLTSGTSEVIKGSKIDSKTGAEIYKNMITAVDTIDGKPVNALQKFAAENPVKYKAVLNYLFHQGFFTNDVKADKLQKAGKNAAIKKFEALLNREQSLSGGSSVQVQNFDETDSLINAAIKL